MKKLKIGFLNVYPYKPLNGQKKGLKFGYCLYVPEVIFDCLVDDDTRDQTFCQLDWIELPFFDPSVIVDPDYLNKMESQRYKRDPFHAKGAKPETGGAYLIETQKDKDIITELERQYGKDLISTILIVFCNEQVSATALELIAAAADSFRKYNTWETPVFSLLTPRIREVLQLNEEWFIL